MRKKPVERENKRECINYIVLKESTNQHLDKLIRVYKESPAKARIIFFNDRNNFQRRRVVVFYYDNGDMKISCIVKSFGISITNRMYCREREECAILYSGKKFYFKNKKTLLPLTYRSVEGFVNQCAIHDVYVAIAGNTLINSKSVDTQKPKSLDFSEMPLGGKIKSLLIKQFTWIGFIYENKILWDTAFNTFTRNKLYNRNDALRYLFKIPLPSIINIVRNFRTYGTSKDLLKFWKAYKNVFTGVENVNPELIKSMYFGDAVKMAQTLGVKVNLSWSPKRLKEEHDTWSKEITYTLVESEELRELRVGKIYEEFAEKTGFRLLRTNKDMLYEGMRQKHCVASYIETVDSGQCGIYHINDYTLELRCETTYFNDNDKIVKLKYSQFRGFMNISPPAELDNEIQAAIIKFNMDYNPPEIIERYLKWKKEAENVVKKTINFNDNMINWGRGIGNQEILPYGNVGGGHHLVGVQDALPVNDFLAEDNRLFRF